MDQPAEISYIGIIAGANYDSTITDCYAEGTIIITSTKNLTGHIGGAVGLAASESNMTNIYADVDIKLSDTFIGYIGGIAGHTEGGSVISKAIYTGNMTLGSSTATYGFITGSLNGTMINCYYDSTSVLTVGEEIKTEGTCTEGEARALSELQSAEFIYNTLFWKPEIWQINEGANPTIKLLHQ